MQTAKSNYHSIYSAKKKKKFKTQGKVSRVIGMKKQTQFLPSRNLHSRREDNYLKETENVKMSRGGGENALYWDFPGGPVAKTLCSQSRGPPVQSLLRELDPTCCN